MAYGLTISIVQWFTGPTTFRWLLLCLFTSQEVLRNSFDYPVCSLSSLATTYQIRCFYNTVGLYVWQSTIRGRVPINRTSKHTWRPRNMGKEHLLCENRCLKVPKNGLSWSIWWWTGKIIAYWETVVTGDRISLAQRVPRGKLAGRKIFPWSRPFGTQGDTQSWPRNDRPNQWSTGGTTLIWFRCLHQARIQYSGLQLQASNRVRGVGSGLEERAEMHHMISHDQ